MTGRHLPWGPCLGILLLACTLAQNKSEDGSAPADIDDSTNSTNSSKKSLLTGDPQKDYIHDPNLPRELNGYNLSNYPFYKRIPGGIDFKCEGLHDGFYASVPHKCQVYHHCLREVRYDFLCANYTAFDQKNFICHFASEVDCKNSPKYYVRNEELYKESSPTTTKPPPPPPISRRERYPERTRGGTRRRRPIRPRPEYYDDYYDDEYLDFYDYEVDNSPPVHKTKKQRGQAATAAPKEEDINHQDTSSPGSSASAASRPIAPSRESLFVRQRAPPKIRPPVPLSERERYDRLQGRQQEKSDDAKQVTTAKPQPKTTTQAPQLDYDDQYSDEVFEKEVSKPKEVVPEAVNSRRKTGHSQRPKQTPVYDDEEEELPRDSKPLATDADSGNHRPRRPFQSTPTSTGQGYGSRRRFGQPSDREEQNPVKEEPPEVTDPPPRPSPRPSHNRGRGRPRPATSSTETPISNEAVEDDRYPSGPSGRGSEATGRPFRPRVRPYQKTSTRYQDPEPDDEEYQEEPLRLRPGYGNRGQPARHQPEEEEEDDLEEHHRSRESHSRRQTQGEGQFRPGGGRRRLRPLASRPLPRRRARPRIPDYDYEY